MFTPYVTFHFQSHSSLLFHSAKLPSHPRASIFSSPTNTLGYHALKLLVDFLNSRF